MGFSNFAIVRNTVVKKELCNHKKIFNYCKYPAVVHYKQNSSFEIHHNWAGTLQVAYLIINPN